MKAINFTKDMGVLRITAKCAYGRNLAVPDNAVAFLFTELLNKATLSKRDLEIAKRMGFRVEVKQTAVEID
jgi:hypothetical protein